MYRIVCKVLSSERRRILAEREVTTISKPLRGVMAAGGVWIFFYGTDADIPSSVLPIAIIFAAVGIVAVLLAIFMQKLLEIGYFSKAAKNGCFPAEVSVGEGGVFIKREDAENPPGTPVVTSVNAEKFFAFSEVGKIEDHGEYFKLNLFRGGETRVFLFKEDFEKGTPEAFKSFINTKRQGL